MRRLSLLFTALCAAFVSVACSSNDFYRARVESTGQANAQASRVKDGVESPVTARYSVEGYGVATAQSVKPYLTLDGAWTPDVSASNGTFEPDAVLVRPLPPEASTPRVIRTTLDGKPALLIPKRVVEANRHHGPQRGRGVPRRAGRPLRRLGRSWGRQRGPVPHPRGGRGPAAHGPPVWYPGVHRLRRYPGGQPPDARWHHEADRAGYGVAL
jgi:hypothetical protein